MERTQDAVPRATDMPTGQMTQAIQHLRRAVLWRDGAGLSDAQLLEHFIERRDEAAFETLVRRHGPMVLGVCRRLLRDYHDADDAFQATFLVLCRKAECIAPKEMVGHWLYGVAYQTALKGRAVAAKRRMRERPLALVPEPKTKSHDLWDELQSVLDQELSRLPYKYRVPFVLCDLEGKAYKTAARQLGWPEGTLSVRLARARKMLAKRLTRHGFAVTGAALAAVLSQNTASACVPPSLLSTTIKAAGLYAAGQVVAAGIVSAEVAACTEGVLKTMLVTKIKTALAVFVTISVVSIGGGAISYSLVAGDQLGSNGQQEGLPPAAKQVGDDTNKKNTAQTDKDKLQGVWKLVRLEEDGQSFRGAKFRETGNLGIDGDRLFDPDFDEPEWTWHGTFKLDTTKNPKRITIFDEGPEGELKFNGIYSLDGDDLRICINEDGTDPAIPTEFKTKKGSPFMFVTFKREKPADAQKKKEPVAVPAGLLREAPGIEKQEKSDKGQEESNGLPVREKPFRQYQVECVLVKVDPTGKDLGADGKGKVLAQPALVVLEGKDSTIYSGGAVALPPDKDNVVEFVDFGVSVRVKVTGLDDGRVRLETALEMTEVDKRDQKGLLLRGNIVRSIARMRLGEAIKLVEKDDQGQARHWVRVQVVKEENITSRARSSNVDSTKKPTYQEVARRLGLSEENLFLFAEAMQGYRDAVPPISDLARDFGMKEIDVFLLQEALQRDIADKAEPKKEEERKRNQSRLDYRLPDGSPMAIDFGFPYNKGPVDKKKGPADNKQGYKPGGDFIFLNSLEYQVPIKANDQQHFNFWLGFFGH